MLVFSFTTKDMLQIRKALQTKSENETEISQYCQMNYGVTKAWKQLAEG